MKKVCIQLIFFRFLFKWFIEFFCSLNYKKIIGHKYHLCFFNDGIFFINGTADVMTWNLDEFRDDWKREMWWARAWLKIIEREISKVRIEMIFSDSQEVKKLQKYFLKFVQGLTLNFIIINWKRKVIVSCIKFLLHELKSLRK